MIGSILLVQQMILFCPPLLYSPITLELQRSANFCFARRTQVNPGRKFCATAKTAKPLQKPAGTSRDVIDSSYAVSWLLFFDNAADQESYQKDPIHLKFVDECKHLWQKVIVYDSIDA